MVGTKGSWNDGEEYPLQVHYAMDPAEGGIDPFFGPKPGSGKLR